MSVIVAGDRTPRMKKKPTARVFSHVPAAVLGLAMFAVTVVDVGPANALSLGYGPLWLNLGGSGYYGRGHRSHYHYSYHHHRYHPGHHASLRHGHHRGGHHGGHGHGGGGGHAPMSPL